MSRQQSTVKSEASQGNAYELSVSPGRKRLLAVVSVGGLVASLVAGFLTEAPTLWGLLPIVLYAVLALLSMDIVVATVIAIASGVLIMQSTPVEVGKLLGDSLAESITVIGLIIMLGAGVGEILKVTGVASTIVKSVMRVVGERNMMAVSLGVMISCVLLVASLGTLAGAIAIATPILLPIAARMGFTKSATAAMLFIGGGAGLALAPFAGSNVAIMSAAEVGYLQYLVHGGGPIALLSLVIGPFVVRWRQRRTAHLDDYYDPEELEGDETDPPPHASRTTLVFAVVLLASVAYAIWTAAGTSFPLLALPAIGIVTAIAGGLSISETITLLYRGATKLFSIFVLFWLLAALFLLIDEMAPFDVILGRYESSLTSASPFVFVVVIALLGWVGVPGATAAQVVLLDEVFGPIAGTLGISAASWVVVMLFASKADTYGPFPNGNMIGVMGLARSTNLKNMMITGWVLLVPSSLMYAIILFVQTR